jgi:hypothetical protein
MINNKNHFETEFSSVMSIIDTNKQCPSKILFLNQRAVEGANSIRIKLSINELEVGEGCLPLNLIRMGENLSAKGSPTP